MNFQTMSKQRKYVLIAAAAGIIGVFCPWVSIFGFSVNGFHGVGIFIFLCLAAAGAFTLMGDQTKNLDKTFWMITLIAGGIAALIMIINLFNAMGGLSAVSFGFYLTLLGSVGVTAAAFMFRSPEDNIKGGFDSLKKDIDSKMNNPTDKNPGNTNPPV